MKKKRLLYLSLILLLFLILQIALAEDWTMFQRDTADWRLVTGDCRAEDWTMFRKDSLHTAYAIETSDTLIHRLAWVFSTEGPIYSSPVIWNHTVYFASTDNNLYAVVDTSGILKWRCRLGNWIESTPTVANGRIYVGCMDHKLYAINAENGEIEWSYETGSWIESSPVIAGNTLYIGGTDHTLYAIDACTGKEKWTFRVRGDIFSSPAFYHDVIYFGADDDTLYAVNSSGQLKWKIGTGGYSIYSSPSIAEGMVVIGTIDNGVKYYHETGNFGSLNNKIMAFDINTGELKWEYVTEPFGLMHSSPAIAYGKVFYTTDQGMIRTLNLTDGNLIWETITPDSSQIWSSTAIAAGVLYITTYSGILYAYDTETGALLGSYSLPGYIHSSPAIANNYLYFGGSDGNLYAFGKPAFQGVVSTDIRLPQEYFLSQNYPNPFNSGTTIKYGLPRSGHVKLSIVNLLGQEVNTLIDEYKECGIYEVYWNGKINEESKVGSGVYIYKLEVGEFVTTKKLLIIK
jgi:outer membrane protein assembly factor BamB